VSARTGPSARKSRASRLGCPCGCTPDRDCVAGGPVPDVDGSCCGQLGFDELKAAVDLGWHCAAGCVARRLDLLEHDDYEHGRPVDGHSFGSAR
jgi:hypothetical protein